MECNCHIFQKGCHYEHEQVLVQATITDLRLSANIKWGIYQHLKSYEWIQPSISSLRMWVHHPLTEAEFEHIENI